MTIWKADQPVHELEALARFIVFSKWIRKDQTIKPNCFFPQNHTDKDPDLSVTRTDDLEETQIWSIGQAVADSRRPPAPAPLYGYGEIHAGELRNLELETEPDPTSTNLNHANIVGWSLELAAQTSKAQEVASRARFVPKLLS